MKSKPDRPDFDPKSFKEIPEAIEYLTQRYQGVAKHVSALQHRVNALEGEKRNLMRRLEKAQDYIAAQKHHIRELQNASNGLRQT